MAKIMRQFLKDGDVSPCFREIFEKKLVPCTIRHLKKGEILWREKEHHKYCYHIINGMIKLNVITRDGREKTLFYYTNGSLLGFQNLSKNKMTITTATAILSTSVYAVEFSLFYAFITENPKYLTALTDYIFHHIAVSAQEIVNISLFNTAERLAELFVLLADEYPEDEGGAVQIPFNNEELAAMVGACRNSICNALALFQKQKLVKKNRGSLIITDLNGLREYTQ